MLTDTKFEVKERRILDRHTCASLRFEEERNVKQVSGWLGHVDPGCTLPTYVHPLDAGLGGGLNLKASSDLRPQGVLSWACAQANVPAKQVVKRKRAKP